jgi:UDP-N-acetylmuramate dehydrogenase
MLESQVQANHPLKSFNSFGFAVLADYLVTIKDETHLREALDYARAKELSLVVLGEGSNVVFRQNINALVLKMAITGIQIIEENESSVLVQVGAGENWHQFILWCLQNNYYGLENLSLIPGAVGAAPIQNIGAYGVEQNKCFDCLEAVNRLTGEIVVFNNSNCEFGYRDSVFKGKFLDQFIITQVSYRLNKQADTQTAYGAIKDELAAMNADPNDPKAVSRAVCNIRRSKLPSPKVIGNAGSFFKNPVVDARTFKQLKSQYQALVAYPQDHGMVKLAAGWMIEFCGWKGFREGDVGVHADQALVLVNYGDGLGTELIELAARIQRSVHDKFGIHLEIEPRIYPAL